MLSYPVTIFLAAFLLFLIQLLMGKYILPWFGGTPAVWSTTMFFFQVLLLAGYAYSHSIVSRLSLRRQGYVHLMLLGASLVVLLLLVCAWDTPITPGVSWQPRPGDNPILRILAILAASVGLPYLVLSTTSPLLQAWFSRVRTPLPAQGTRLPYRLYALSNLGSLLALVGYPVVIEPWLTVKMQANLWSLGYLVFALGCGYTALRLLRSSDDGMERQSPVAPSIRLGIGRPLLWLALSACASLLLLAATNQMTQDIAVIPFLWVLPLTLYLLSFILCFAGPQWYSRWYIAGLFVMSFLYCWVLLGRTSINIVVQLAVYAALLFCVCMVCHGEMVRLRPGAEHLTQFYLLVSLGGALGGVLVSLLAPLIFDNFWEFPLGLIACWLLLIAVLHRDRNSFLHRMFFPTASALAVALTTVSVVVFMYIRTFEAKTLEASRNFYGIQWVIEEKLETGDLLYTLGHGAINHGSQYISPERRQEPTTYFGRDSGGGLALLYYPRDQNGLRVGIAGLGVGVLATYGQPGDTFRFYEINPDVIRLAEGAGGFFSYLSDTPAVVEIVPGDARLSLERELAETGSQQYDILILDAFSSDSVPIHLLTREGLKVYLAHLKTDGVLVFNISNRHLDLQPVLAQLAQHLGMQSVFIESAGDGPALTSSKWVLITDNQAFLSHPQVASRSKPVDDYGGRIRLWTDDYSNLFQILY